MNGASLRQQIADEAESLALLLETAWAAAEEIEVAIAEARRQNPSLDQTTGMSDVEWAISLFGHHQKTCVALLKRGHETLLGLGPEPSAVVAA